MGLISDFYFHLNKCFLFIKILLYFIWKLLSVSLFHLSVLFACLSPVILKHFDSPLDDCKWLHNKAHETQGLQVEICTRLEFSLWFTSGCNFSFAHFWKKDFHGALSLITFPKLFVFSQESNRSNTIQYLCLKLFFPDTVIVIAERNDEKKRGKK